MSIAPIRDLGAVGVIADAEPFDNDFKSFTFAKNVRFENKRISRGPLFSTTGTLALNASPRFAFSYKQLSGTNQYHIANRDGTITQWASAGLGVASTESTISPVAWVAANYDTSYTTTAIQDVVYLNRSDHVPWYKTKNGSLFAELPNVAGLGWDSTWRAAAIRSVGGVVVALNVTKGATAYPTMVKTSDYPAFGLPPAEWVSSPTNSATEQIIADLAEPLIDGWPMRDRLILYTENECWSMEPRYDTLMFNYRRLFTKESSSGVINQNCVGENDNVHYVFGSTDIWFHDGFKRQTLAAGKNRNFIYNSMDKSQSAFFFVQPNPRLNEMMFCYVSNDAYCKFPAVAGAGCNRAAVFNYLSGTWTFYDLPYVVGGALGVPFTGSTYTDMGSLTYAELSGAFSSFGDATKLALLLVGTAQSGSYGSLSCAVRAFDRVGQASSNGVLDSVACGPVYIENQGIDLDALEVELRGYKVIKSVYPEGKFTPDAGSLSFSFSVKDYAGASQSAYSDPQTYDGNGYYKLDFNEPGRFIDMKITSDDLVDFSLSGLDFEFTLTGKR